MKARYAEQAYEKRQENHNIYKPVYRSNEYVHLFFQTGQKLNYFQGSENSEGTDASHIEIAELYRFQNKRAHNHEVKHVPR